MWSTFRSIKGEFYIKEIPETTFKGIVYMSLDCGITWNYLGKTTPTSEVWTWCSSDTKRIVNYIRNTLFANGFLPIFYTREASKEFIAKVWSYIGFSPPSFIGISPDLMHGLISKSWIGKKNDLIEVLPPFGGKFTDNCFFYNIGPIFPKVNDEVINYKAKELDLAEQYEVIINGPPSLIILMGQQGSGKSTIAAEFAAKDWTIIDEKEAGKIKRNKSNKVRFNELVKNIGNPTGGIGSRGVIIDSTNPKKENRDLFASFAIAAGKPYKVGWVTRPGFFSNELRDVSVPLPALYIYSKNLEPPTEQEHGVRLV